MRNVQTISPDQMGLFSVLLSSARGKPIAHRPVASWVGIISTVILAAIVSIGTFNLGRSALQDKQSLFYDFRTQTVAEHQPIWVGGPNPTVTIAAHKCVRRDLMTYGSYSFVSDGPTRVVVPGPATAAINAVRFPKGCRDTLYANPISVLVPFVSQGIRSWHMEGTNIGLDPDDPGIVNEVRTPATYKDGSQVPNARVAPVAPPIAVARWVSESFSLTLEKQ